MPRKTRISASPAAPPTQRDTLPEPGEVAPDNTEDPAADEGFDLAESEEIAEDIGLFRSEPQPAPTPRVNANRVTREWLQGSNEVQSRFVVSVASARGAWTYAARLGPPVTQAMIEDRVTAWCGRRGMSGTVRVAVRRYDGGEQYGAAWGWVLALPAAPMPAPPVEAGAGGLEYRLARLEMMITQQAQAAAQPRTGFKEIIEGIALLAPLVAAARPVLESMLRPRDSGSLAQFAPVLELVAKQSEELGRLRAIEGEGGGYADEGQPGPDPAAGLGAMLAPLLGQHGPLAATLLETWLASKAATAATPPAAEAPRGPRRIRRVAPQEPQHEEVG